MEARSHVSEGGFLGRLDRLPAWALAAGAVALIAAVLALLAIAGGDALPERAGPPVEELAVERTVLEPGRIELKLRNVGPDPVRVSQAYINDAYVDFQGPERVGRLASGTLTLDYPWQEGQPYLVSLLTSTGAVIEHEIPVAVETPDGGAGFLGLMALLGTYVGIIPVVLGMLLLPAMRRLHGRWVRMMLAFTVGLLGFLVVDGTLEALELAGESGGAFGGTQLVFLGAALAFLALTGLDRLLSARGERSGAARASALRLAMMIAIGIGLHNLGEGLAIGSAYAVGELALGTFLVVGFAIHNTTEGIAIVAPLARERPSILRLVGLGLVAGGPAIIGALIGASIDNAELSALLIGVGVGAIVQVIVQIVPSLRDRAGRALGAANTFAIAAGVLALYLTSLLVTI